jgi:hypothetical protein
MTSNPESDESVFNRKNNIVEFPIKNFAFREWRKSLDSKLENEEITRDQFDSGIDKIKNLIGIWTNSDSKFLQDFKQKEGRNPSLEEFNKQQFNKQQKYDREFVLGVQDFIGLNSNQEVFLDHVIHFYISQKFKFKENYNLFELFESLKPTLKNLENEINSSNIEDGEVKYLFYLNKVLSNVNNDLLYQTKIQAFDKWQKELEKTSLENLIYPEFAEFYSTKSLEIFMENWNAEDAKIFFELWNNNGVFPSFPEFLKCWFDDIKKIETIETEIEKGLNEVNEIYQKTPLEKALKALFGDLNFSNLDYDQISILSNFASIYNQKLNEIDLKYCSKSDKVLVYDFDSYKKEIIEFFTEFIKDLKKSLSENPTLDLYLQNAVNLVKSELNKL